MHLRHLALAFILPALAHAETGKTLGCYSKVENVGSVLKFSFQSHDYCLDHCSKNKFPVAALTMGATCYCSTDTPAESSKTDEEKCNRKCSGWPEDNCGGVDAYYVLTTGVDSGKSSSNNNSNSDSTSSADANTKAAFKTILVASTATASVNTGTDQIPVSTASTMAGGIVVAPHQSSGLAGAATSALKANATPMATNASGSAAAVTAGSTSTSASPSATPNAAGSLRAGSAAGFVVAGLGLLL